MVFFCFKQKTAYEMRISDWSSDVCSSDLKEPASVACRIAGSVGTHPDWVRGAILLLGFMFAMTGFSFYSAWAVDRSHDLGWSSRRDTVALMIGLWGSFGLIGVAAWLAFGA